MSGSWVDLISDFYYFAPIFGLGYFGAKHRDLHQLMFFVLTGGFCTIGAGLVVFLYLLEFFAEPLTGDDAAACTADPECSDEVINGTYRTHPAESVLTVAIFVALVTTQADCRFVSHKVF